MSATPRARRHPTTSTTTDIEIFPLPPYEPPIAPLIPNCQQKLTNLAKSNTLKNLNTHIQHAAEKLTDSAGDVNERLTEVREKVLRSRKRNRAQYEGDQQQDGDVDQGAGAGAGVGEGENEENHRLEKTEEEVKGVTTRLEEGIRRIVDAEVLVDGLSGVLTDLSKVAEQDAAASASTTSSSSTARRLRRRLNPHNDSDDEDDDDDDDDEPSQSQSQSQPQPQNPTPYTATLTQKLKTEASNWSNQSLTQRYSTNNTYIGFYRMVHDAKHPGNDIPPLPHASTWFRHLEGAAGSNNGTPREGSESEGDDVSGARAHSIQPKHEGNENEDDDEEEEGEEELEIASERISLKCPLTLLTFQEPLTSTKCPHSFEKQAILDMISHSPTTVPPSDGGRNRVRAVKCPVCSVLLKAQDLRKDPVLSRRVRRMEAMMQREEDDDEDEDGGGGGRRRSKGMRKSGITVGSDEDEDEDDEEEGEEEESEEEQPVRIKRERTAG